MNKIRWRFSAVMLLVVLLTQLIPHVSFSKGQTLPALAEHSFQVEVEPVSDNDVDNENPTEMPAMLQVEILREERDASEQPAKRILIYHTHTYESYEKEAGAAYKETEKWRTTDDTYNVTAVGAALTSALTAIGYEVVHDRTAFEPPSHDTAYERSLDMLEQRAARGEQFDLYIDLHRDAIAAASTIKRTVNIGGEKVARFMIVVGKGTTGGYEIKPDWEANLAIANRITKSLNDQCDSLARDVKVKTGRFNQHVADCCVLIECGMNCNTLDEVLAGIPYLAQAISMALSGKS